MEAFGKTLRQLRCNYGISQQKLADAFKLKRTTITNYESGRNFPSLDMLVEIVKFFDVSSDLMLGLADDVQVEHYKPKRSAPAASLYTWVGDEPKAPLRTPEEQARIAQLESRVNTLLEMAGSLADEIQELRSGKL